MSDFEKKLKEKLIDGMTYTEGVCGIKQNEGTFDEVFQSKKNQLFNGILAELTNQSRKYFLKFNKDINSWNSHTFDTVYVMAVLKSVEDLMKVDFYLFSCAMSSGNLWPIFINDRVFVDKIREALTHDRDRVISKFGRQVAMLAEVHPDIDEFEILS